MTMTRHEDLDEEDAVTLLSILVETGLVDPSKLKMFDLHKETYFRCQDAPSEGATATATATTRGRRITRARIGKWNREYWEFHTPKVFELFEKLDALEILEIDRCASFRVTEAVSRFPNLKHLDVSCYYSDGGTIIGPPALMEVTNEDSNLETLVLSTYTMESENDLAIFLFDVLPFFPKLSTFSVGWNKIKSFQNIAQRIQTNQNSANISRLRKLNLGRAVYDTQDERERMRQLPQHDPMEIEAKKTLLLAFKELHVTYGAFNSLRFRKHGCGSDEGIDYLLEINNAGRVLVETTKDEGVTSINSSIPLSVWPVILARAWRWNVARIEDCGISPPNGIYYLLQSVPVLQEASKRRSMQ